MAALEIIIMIIVSTELFFFSMVQNRAQNALLGPHQLNAAQFSYKVMGKHDTGE